MCRVLGVSPSGYYAWLKRGPSEGAWANWELLKEIRAIHEWSDGRCRAPKEQEELEARGRQGSLNRVARLIHEDGLQGVSRRSQSKPRKTRQSRQARPAPDLVERDFTATGPDQLSVTDTTYVPMWAEFVYPTVALDAWSRRLVGWSMASHLRTELVLEALNMALWQREPDGVIHHPDQGRRYTSSAFGRRCREMGVRPSMGSVGHALDNALCESRFATFDCGLIERCSFGTWAEAPMTVFRFIEGWYNPNRRHPALDCESPVDYEKKHARAA